MAGDIKIPNTVPNNGIVTPNTNTNKPYTVQDFVRDNKGYSANYDKNTGMSSIINTGTGQTLSFKSGQANNDYGILGGLTNNSNNIDANKVMNYFNTPKQTVNVNPNPQYASTAPIVQQPQIDPNADYTRLIQESIGSGYYDPKQIQAWASARDAKIAGNPKYSNAQSSAQLLQSLGFNPNFGVDPSAPQPYVNQYEQQLQGILTQLQNTADYNSPYAGQIQSILNQLQNRNFSYDPSTDVSYQNASKDMSRNVMEQMNERGILNSTVTENQIQQGQKELQDVYYDKAQQRYQQDTDNMYKMASFLQTLDSEAYNRDKDKTQKLYDMATFINGLDQSNFEKYKQTVDQYYTQKEFTYKQAQDSIEKKRNAINDAWARVQELGYVDNQASIILGVKVGTPSYEAAKEKRLRQYELDDYAKQLKDKRQDAKTEYNNQLNLLAVKQKYDEKNSATDFARQKQLIAINHANDIDTMNKKSAQDKENQKYLTFNDAQSQLTAFKKQITTDKSDEFGNVIKGLNPKSVGYFKQMGDNIIPLLEQGIINPDQANALAVQFTGASYDNLVKTTNYSDNVNGYDSWIKTGKQTKSQVYNRIKNFNKEEKALLGDYYYKALLNKYK